MAQNYTRQSSMADGDTITAALFNNEYNQLVNAFAYSSSSASSTGHRHDGSAGQGGNVPQIGDLDFLNKVVVDGTNNRVGFFVEVSSSAVEQVRIQDGAIVPVTDNDIDLGTSSVEFKDLFLDGTAHIDTLDVDVNATVAGTLGVTGVTTLSSDLSVGGNLTVTGNATIAGNLTFGDAATDTVAFSADVASNLLPSADDTYDLGASGSEWKDLYVDGVAYLDAINFNGTAITATAAELNIMDGVTSTAAEINLLDGVTATTTELNYNDTGSAVGTVVASKVVTVDANKDVSSFRNITLTGELDAGSLDISGDADIDGTLETDALSINGTTVTATAAELNILDGVTSTAAELNILDGVTSTAAELNILDGVTSTAAEINIVDGDTSATSTTLADADRVVVNDSGTMVQVALTDFETYFESALDTLSNVTTVGALNSGSITSGFGAIDNGSSAITTTGTVTYGSLSDGSITITAFVDEDDMSSNSATLVPTQQSVKAYVDSQVTAQDLDFQADSGGALSIDLDSETLTFTGGTGIDTSGSGNAVTFAIDSTVATLTGSQTLTNKSLTAPTLTGTAVVASLDISGDIDVNGTTNLDVVDIDGAVDMASTLAVGGVVTANAGVVVDNITIDGQEIDVSSGDLTLDVAGDIHLDADGGDVNFKDGGTTYGFMAKSNNDLLLGNVIADGDVLIRGNDSDGGGNFTALTLDMSNAGSATFNGRATIDPADGDADDQYALFIRNNEATAGRNYGAIVRGGSNSSDESFSVRNFDNSATYFKVRGDGNVGIGTSSAGTFRTKIKHSAASVTTGLGIEASANDSVLRVFHSGSLAGFNATYSSTGAYVPMVFNVGAGGEAMRIDTSGRIGVGGTPNANWRNDATDDVLMLGTEATLHSDAGVTTELWNNAYVDNSDTFKNISTRGASRYMQYSGAHKWFTAASASAGSTISTEINTTPKMVLDISGNLGIGVSSAQEKLHVYTTGHSRVEAESTTGVAAFKATNNQGSYAWYVDNSADAFHLFDFTDNAQRVTVDGNGAVGVGTSSPQAKLHSYTSGTGAIPTGQFNQTADDNTALTLINANNSATYSAIKLETRETQAAGWMIANEFQSAFNGDLVFRGRDGGSSSAEVLRLKSNGNVGIGVAPTFTPGGSRRLLQVTNGSSGGQIALSNDSSEAENPRIFSDADNLGFATATTGGGVMQFYTAGSERMRIDSSGNVSVGHTTAGGAKFAISDSGNATIQFFPEISTDTNLTQHYDLTAAAYMTSDNRAAAHLFKIGTSEAMRINSNGTIGINSTATNRELTIAAITSSGQCDLALRAADDNNFCQLLFGDTSADNTGIVGYKNGDEYMFFYTNNAEAMRLTASQQLLLPGVKDDTTSDAANMNIRSSDGLVRRSTSSRRYKNTITDATHGLTELLNLRPVTYKGNNDGDRLFGGLIAEEVHEAGLTEFVQYNSDDEPDALAYGHMVSLCIKAIQEQQTLIESLTDRIAALENN